MSKPIILQLGDDIKWNHELYAKLRDKFAIRRSYSMDRAEFKAALERKDFGDFVAMFRPFWNTGGEMGNWDAELIIKSFVSSSFEHSGFLDLLTSNCSSLLPTSCRIFTSAGAGFDWVDTKALGARNIIYCNSAAACTESVADGAIWLLLSTFRAFTWSAACARSADPAQFLDATRNTGSLARNPNGHTLGIIGLGKIGFRLAQKAHAAFGMKIIYNDIRRMPQEVEAAVDAEYYSSLDAMLGLSDCVVVATPFAGHKVLNANNFPAMKPGARLVNIARGKCVDEDALVDALESGRISAAGLDVHYNEPHVNKKLAKMSNVELLSHTTGATVDSHMGFERLGMENILQFFEIGKAISPVNLEWIKASL
ncbi:D-isomer specific 2-hydroxyacid dehydrogenase [Aulographum hederae CBS 113979]|uniref:D-isomer specific 2-hydroxyacid dehydrogenase n=1 Tax=Aulographum hederae CBS 113979 TaxID=1176131 RepID=A0A6G1HB57_9PEZI|nr:D-isomer specific 2-hydroxyacid dehydrogenase [Aulographum hederae CBS 113979]